MKGERIFLDTWFILALLNTHDIYHGVALRLLPRIRAAAKVVVTDAVFVETCNGMARRDRSGAVRFALACYADKRFEVVPVDRELMSSALAYYERAGDKAWGLTDCISFLVMRERNIQVVATGDHHFRQAGFIPLIDGDN